MGICKNCCKSLAGTSKRAYCCDGCYHEYQSKIRDKRNSNKQINKEYDHYHDEGRDLVCRRDGYLCIYCGDNLKNINSPGLTIDHIYPYSLGGLNTFSNCAVSCKPCNLKKSNKLNVDEINYYLDIVNKRNEYFNIDPDKLISFGGRRKR